MDAKDAREGMRVRGTCEGCPANCGNKGPNQSRGFPRWEVAEFGVGVLMERPLIERNPVLATAEVSFSNGRFLICPVGQYEEAKGA